MSKYTAVKTTKYEIPRAKISDGKSVSVIVKEDTARELKPQTFATVGGFTGLIIEGVKIEANTPTKVVVTIEQAEYETAQIKSSVEFTTGDFLYFVDDVFTNVAPADNPVKVGRLVSPKNSLNAITFILLPQVY